MRIKLLYPPRAHGANTWGPPLSRIPLIGLPILKTILEKRGFCTDIDDLDMRLHVHNLSAREPITMDAFLDKPRVKRFLNGGEDDGVEESADRLLRLTKTKGYDIIGFSIVDEFNISCQASTLVLSKILRERTRCLTVVGGADISCLKNNFTRCELEACVDLVTFETPHMSPWRLVELAKILDGQEQEKPSTYNDSRAIIRDNYGKETPALLFSKRLAAEKPKFSQQPYEGLNIRLLDSIDLPDFRGLPLEHYTYLPPDIEEHFGVKRGILVLPYVFSINCPYGCAFCGNSLHGTTSFVSFEAGTIAEHLSTLSKRHRTRHFCFLNENINPSREFTGELVRELRERDLGLMISDCANFRNLDRRLLGGLYDIGVRKLVYGLESPNDKMLQYVNKGITLAHARNILIEADRLGIWNEAEVICGMPFETPEIEEQIIAFMKDFRTIINYWWIHKFKLLNSKMLEHPKKYGLTNIREPPQPDVQGWAFDEVGGLSWAEKYNQIKRAHRRVLDLSESFEREGGYVNRDECLIRLYMLYSLLGEKKEVVRYMQTHLGARGSD